jgi:glycerate kinase
VLIAADKFKGSLTAVQVAGHVEAGLRKAVAGLTVESIPVADGGDGTVDAAVASGFERRTVRVTGPLGEPVEAAYALRGGTAVVELAEASGLWRLPPGVFAPLAATTYGTGELLRAALDAGARDIVLGVGGSATTDGGAGLLAALGARLLDARGEQLPPGGAALRDLADVDLSGLDPRLAGCSVVLASDVDNPLLGPSGAAAVFAPQKGADADGVAQLEAGLARWADRVAAATGRDLSGEAGAGAAGGTGFAALAVLGARRRPGIDVVLDEIDADRFLATAGLVIVGEGRLDAQTLRGKAPVGVAARTPARVPVVAVSGDCTVAEGALRAAGISGSWTLLAEAGGDLARAMSEAGPLLEQVGRRLAEHWLQPERTSQR